ncbi:YdeI/OmpD-associated family protein [Siphonobacter sp.]|uniref:YdeI/OmpD-associated family protein n=1 Tax=Siphonobacter sp. TaxID=1869184 RepID=UPI003B3BC777
MKEKTVETFCPRSPQHWRDWLHEHHATQQSVWLLFYKKKSGLPTLTWSEAVDEALCFGWIDSVRKPVSEEAFLQFFSRRKARSTWSKVNKEKIRVLTEQGLMMPAGFQSIETAQQNGSWTILDEVEQGVIPEDLRIALEEKPRAFAYFLQLSKTDTRNILQWLVLARRAETRKSRIAEVVERADQRLKPKFIQGTKK